MSENQNKHQQKAFWLKSVWSWSQDYNLGIISQEVCRRAKLSSTLRRMFCLSKAAVNDSKKKLINKCKKKLFFCLFTWRDQGCWGRQVCCRFPAWWQEQCCSSLASSTNNQPTGDYQFLDKIHIWKCGRGIKQKFGLWSFVAENGPKNLFRCPPRVAVCRVYKVTPGLHKSAKCAIISTIYSHFFGQSVKNFCRSDFLRVLHSYFHFSNSVAKCEAWWHLNILIILFYNKVWLRGEECFL